MKSDNLWKVAKNNPRNTSEMLEMGLTENEVRVRGKRFYNCLLKQDAFRLMITQNLLNVFLKILVIKKQFDCYKKKVNSLTPAGLTPEILASKRTLDELIKWVWKYDCSQDKLPELLIGWRKPIAEKLVDILK